MAEVKNINALSMESIDLDEVYQQPEQGKILMNDDIVFVMGGHLQNTRFLLEERFIRWLNLD